MSKLYDNAFYDSQADGSYRSALEYVPHLLEIFRPTSVVDLGCGRGTWLKAFHDHGVERLVGLDGHWNNQAQMVDQAITFVPTDLGQRLASSHERFDLAISLEVAEHLKAEFSKDFVTNITSLSDVVMFGAAYTKQGGTDHINEQPHTYWAKMFIELGYVPYDLFRPTFWGKETVEYWYQQNTFLYVNERSDVNHSLRASGCAPIVNIEFMNCIHPQLYSTTVDTADMAIQMKRRLAAACPKPLRPLARRLQRILLG